MLAQRKMIAVGRSAVAAPSAADELPDRAASASVARCPRHTSANLAASCATVKKSFDAMSKKALFRLDTLPAPRRFTMACRVCSTRGAVASEAASNCASKVGNKALHFEGQSAQAMSAAMVAT